jgi:DNA helicase-2/ATP-dependent DNA helicase PcrA
MSEYTKAYQELNPQQKQAVDTLIGPVMVVAGPGSGKTQLLSLRVANIINTQDVLSENIICLTFTDAAAYNMRQRLASFIGKEAYKVNIYTFHSFGQSLLKDYTEYTAGMEKVAIDDVYIAEIIGDIVAKLPYNHILIPKGLDKSTLIKNIAQSINYIKQAGLTPTDYVKILNQNQAEFAKIIPIIQNLSQISLSGKKDRTDKLNQIRDLVLSIPISTSNNYFDTYSTKIQKSILEALEETELLEDKYTPLSQWKSKYLIKGKDGQKTLIDVERLEKQKAIAEIYEQYQKYLDENQLLDFSDMLLNALTLLKENEGLRDKLQEKYQFILVDEFQDTNEAQMQLVLNLVGDNPETNILVVGDDDQAVYGFQGADVSHMLSFQNKFPTAQLIVLTTNYRSRQEILDIARQVIIQGKDRLENRIEVLEKKLESAKLRQDGDLAYYEFENQAKEYTWIASTIEEYRKQQMDLSEIAIIARNHKALEAIVPFLSKYDLPIDYDKQYNLLNETIIHQLVIMLQFIYSLTPTQSPRNDLLPEILSYPFWGLDNLDIWQFFQNRDYKETYIKRLYNSSDKSLQEIGQLFLNLAILSEYETIEVILFKLIGSIDGKVDTNSRFHQYYFGNDTFELDQNSYIANLAKVEAFIHNITSYKKGKRITLADGLNTIKAYQNQGGMMVNLSLNSGKHTIKLMTAHKAKGLEFETVFVIGAHAQGWSKKGKSFPYPFPINLPIVPRQDSEDDFLRLLFVALTRSKVNLFITSHLYDEKGKEKPALPYLDFINPKVTPDIENKDLVEGMFKSIQPLALHTQEVSFLEGVIQNYKLSASHINKFVDLEYGGPLSVLESVLLKFPSMHSPAMTYGNIVHKVFNYISIKLQSKQAFPDMDELNNFAIKALYQEKLSIEDTDKVLQKLQDQIPDLIKAKKDGFLIPHNSEYNLGQLFLEYEGVPLTGVIDRIEENPDYYTVVDFKTGNPILSWDNKSKANKLDSFKRQLWFYALLLKLSGQYQDKPIYGRIDFLEPNIEGEYISLDLIIIDTDIDYIAKLVLIIYHKILNLDFPDISIYKDNNKNTNDFIKDLLEHKI